jgi:hypothetical protein
MTLANVQNSDQLNFSVDEGAQRVLTFTCENPDGTPQNFTGIVVEFSAQATDGTQTVKILNTDVSNSMGSVNIPTPTNGQITLTLYPEATEAMFDNRGGYTYWALWAQPNTSSAYTLLNGQITPNRVAQP